MLSCSAGQCDSVLHLHRSDEVPLESDLMSEDIRLPQLPEEKESMPDIRLRSGLLELAAEANCQQCGNCCRRFRINGGKRVESLRWKYGNGMHNGWTRESWNREAALLRRILVLVKVKNGVAWYRCSMLWRNRETGKWECLIHDTRPTMCREFMPGNASIPRGAACRKRSCLEQPNEVVDEPTEAEPCPDIEITIP